MPVGDGTGPLGLGPMTGRAAGYCAGYPVPGYANPIPGLGFSGRGGYWGVNPPYGPAPYPQSVGPYGPAPYPQSVGPYGYGPAYTPVWGQPLGRGLGPWFGRGWGRGWGRGRGFGRGRGWGRGSWGW